MQQASSDEGEQSRSKRQSMIERQSTGKKSIPDEMKDAVPEQDPFQLIEHPPLDAMKASLVDTINAHGSFAENLPIHLYQPKEDKEVPQPVGDSMKKMPLIQKVPNSKATRNTIKLLGRCTSPQ